MASSRLMSRRGPPPNSVRRRAISCTGVGVGTSGRAGCARRRSMAARAPGMDSGILLTEEVVARPAVLIAGRCRARVEARWAENARAPGRRQRFGDGAIYARLD